MVIAALIAVDEVSWTGILVAALGSSALGAIVGGYLTTRMRGRHEREEAWRTRLIEAADDLNKTLIAALRTLGDLLPAASTGDVPLRDANGALTPETAKEVEDILRLLDQAEVRLGRFELLFGVDSEPYVYGHRTMHLLGRAVGLVRGRSSARRLVEAVVADLENPGAGPSLLLAANQGHDLPDFDLVRARAPLPGDFDQSSDTSVALWAREFHHAAGESAHSYMRAARTAIEHYKTT